MNDSITSNSLSRRKYYRMIHGEFLPGILTRDLQGLMILLNSGMPGKKNSTTTEYTLRGVMDNLTPSNTDISSVTRERFRSAESEDIGRSI